jgi:hypothetical protein
MAAFATRSLDERFDRYSNVDIQLMRAELDRVNRRLDRVDSRIDSLAFKEQPKVNSSYFWDIFFLVGSWMTLVLVILVQVRQH